MASRKDAGDALHSLTLGIIPGGSGNGLAASLGSPDPVASAWAIIRGQTHAMDLFSVLAESAKGSRLLWGFLAIEWAMVSVIDLESEPYRFLGPLRFDIKGLLETLSNDAYGCKLWYLPANEGRPKAAQKAAKGSKLPDQDLVNGDRSKWVAFSGELSVFLASNLKKIQIAPGPHAKDAELSDGCLDLILIPRVDRSDLMSAMLDFDSGKFADQKGVQYKKVLAFTLEPDLTQKIQAPIGVDGERLTATKISVQSHQAMVEVFYDFGD